MAIYIIVRSEIDMKIKNNKLFSHNALTVDCIFSKILNVR